MRELNNKKMRTFVLMRKKTLVSKIRRIINDEINIYISINAY